MYVDKKTTISVMAGIAAFGAAVWAVKKLPSNAVTTPVKDVTNAVTNG